ETRNFFWYGVPFVEVVINSLYPMNFFLDTGANKSSLTPTGRGKIDSHSPKLKSSLGCTIGAGGGKFRKIQKLERATITIDKFNISPLTLSIHEDYNEYIIQKDGTLGGDILKNFIVTLDPVRGRFILKYLSNDH
ncbi:MAG: aspartyl protease family protein, partial [Candidatus Marinimicrobia bacterium]|nr:aspartyl protease family protein [Candidatus Neomarinimicrobiota bacterium]